MNHDKSLEPPLTQKIANLESVSQAYRNDKKKKEQNRKRISGCGQTWRIRHVHGRRHGRDIDGRIDKVGCGTSFMLSGDEPVNGRVHKRKHCSGAVKEVKVELFSLTAHVLRQRHGLDDETFNAAFYLGGLRVVQVRVRP